MHGNASVGVSTKLEITKISGAIVFSKLRKAKCHKVIFRHKPVNSWTAVMLEPVAVGPKFKYAEFK